MKAKQALESWVVNALIALFVIAASTLSAISVTGNANTSKHVQEIAECLQGYNDSVQSSSAARSQLAQEQTDITVAIISAVASAHTKKDVDVAFATYLSAQSKINQEKEEHPVPPPPSEVCK